MKRKASEAPASDGGIQAMSDVEHVKLRSGMYVGSTAEEEREALCARVGDEGAVEVKRRRVEVVPALLKLYDEVVSNALDEAWKGRGVTAIKISVTDNAIVVHNNGEGIVTGMHSALGVPVIQAAFGTCKTSSNYNDTADRTVAGLNGLGVKLTNIFSDSFRVRVRHAATGDSYTQEWTDQMGTVGAPEVRAGSKPAPGFVEVTFQPVAALLGAAGTISGDACEMLMARAMEVALAAPKGTKVHFNGTLLRCDTLRKYMDALYPGAQFSAVDDADPNWAVGVVHASHAAIHGLVNGVGANAGSHVTYFRGRLMPAIVEAVKAKRGDKGGAVSAASLDAHAAWFVVARVNRPAFDSQCKEKLVSCERLSDYTPAKAFVEKIAGSPIAAAALEDERAKTSKKLARAMDGKKTATVNVPKLYDARLAGTKDSKRCSLYLTEGDSALSYALAGRAELGADTFGAYPLRGKPLNTREATAEQIAKNEEIKAVMTALGLRAGEDSPDKLRYGALVILSDADADGAHIRGLVLNFIHHGWPNLAKSGFVRVMPTPLVVARRGAKVIEFATTGEFDAHEAANDMRGYTIKYFKGLGTWRAEDAKLNFRKREPVPFVDATGADEAMEKAFSKKMVPERKLWLCNAIANVPVAETYSSPVPIPHFIDHDVALFGVYSMERSIPSVCDGLKVCQRKVIWVTMFVRSYISKGNEVKVAQLGAAVSEISMYLHGEQSLFDTIINLGQRFCGSNNLPLLFDNGNFGSRLGKPASGPGSDAASPRYIFTYSTGFANALMDKADLAVLPRLTEEGKPVEPETLAPCLPTVLINGCSAIATAYSTTVPPYNPREVLANVRSFLKDGPDVQFAPMAPFYAGFKGAITADGDGKWRVTGVYTRKGDDFTITEVPVSVGFAKLAGIYSSDDMQLVDNRSTGSSAHFVVRFRTPEALQAAEKKGIEKALHLVDSVSTKNMHLFKPDGTIHLYANTSEILSDFCVWRLGIYVKRKAHLVHELTNQAEVLRNRHRFVSEIIAGSIVVQTGDEAALRATLANKAYLSMPEGGYDYLCDIKLVTITMDRAAKLAAQLRATEEELEMLRKRSPQDLWSADLDAVELTMAAR